MKYIILLLFLSLFSCIDKTPCDNPITKTFVIYYPDKYDTIKVSDCDIYFYSEKGTNKIFTISKSGHAFKKISTTAIIRELND